MEEEDRIYFIELEDKKVYRIPFGPRA